MRVIVMIVVVVAVNGLPLSTQARLPVYRSGVEIVALAVSVLDDQQHYVTNLDRLDFELLESGVRREITLFGAAAVPVDIMLVLDISSSMMGSFDVISAAAGGFIRHLRARDRAAVIAVGTRAAVLQPFTSDTGRLEHAIRSVSPEGKTALHDALYIAADALLAERRRYTAIRRQAVVVLSDGRDTSSLVGAEEALAAVRRAGVVAFAISPDGRLGVGQLRYGQTRERLEGTFALTTLARETGGRIFFVDDFRRLAAIYADIAHEIHHQYTIGFEPDRRSGGRFRQLLVRVVSRPGAIVRTRRGFN